MNSFFLLKQAGLTTGKAILKQCSGIKVRGGWERGDVPAIPGFNQKNKLRGMAVYIILIADSLCWSAILSYTNVMTLAWF